MRSLDARWPHVVRGLVAVALSGCARTAQPPSSGTGTLAPGNYEFALRHGARDRSYLVHVPARAMNPAPLVLAFHGGGGNAAGFERYAELDGVADREGFIVAYPNGTSALGGLLTFSAGDGCCGYAMNARIDDVGFAIAIVSDLGTRVGIDIHRIYATGHSNGAIMSHRLAAERPDLIAAIVAVSGSLDLAHFAPARSVPVMQIHSVDDPRALYAGGLGPPFPGTNARVTHQPVQAGLDRWIAADGCSSRGDTVEVRRGAAGTRDAGITATKIVWRGCRESAEVVHWKLTGSGHGWPGDARPAAGELLVGRQTTIVRAAEEVWGFVSRFRR